MLNSCSSTCWIPCDICGEKITNMKMLKSLKDVMNPYSGKCPSCGQKCLFVLKKYSDL